MGIFCFVYGESRRSITVGNSVVPLEIWVTPKNHHLTVERLVITGVGGYNSHFFFSLLLQVCFCFQKYLLRITPGRFLRGLIEYLEVVIVDTQCRFFLLYNIDRTRHIYIFFFTFFFHISRHIFFRLLFCADSRRSPPARLPLPCHSLTCRDGLRSSRW